MAPLELRGAVYCAPLILQGRGFRERQRVPHDGAGTVRAATAGGHWWDHLRLPATAHHRFADGANSPGGGGDVVAEDPRSRQDLPSADAQRATAGWQPLGCWRTQRICSKSRRSSAGLGSLLPRSLSRLRSSATAGGDDPNLLLHLPWPGTRGGEPRLRSSLRLEMRGVEGATSGAQRCSRDHGNFGLGALLAAAVLCGLCLSHRQSHRGSSGRHLPRDG
mmetsp:Transcript_9450/g.20904  ORF Transcript_9450/g.20904 Transcript_9450/m.20904 type:complete len:220 (+) Transcript_9450:1498-2157(+)